jgi:hypothetical protein
MQMLIDHYESMKSYIEFELGRSPGNIGSTALGDWNTPVRNSVASLLWMFIYC